MQSSEFSQPLLSILIPAYNYASGVLQIVVPLLKEDRPDVEVLVHDDSSNDEVETALRSLPSFKKIRYVRNRPGLGAVKNWNSLLSEAGGKYLILIHHDDYPLSENFASELTLDLKKRNWPDVLLMTPVAHDISQNRVKFGVCDWFRLFVVKKFPAYLLRRNVIGPPAAIVVRRDIFPSYDTQLKWLVDANAYYTLFSKGFAHVECSEQIIVSTSGLADSITTSIADAKKSITRAELTYIAANNQSSRLWFSNEYNGSILSLILGFEWLLWGLIKLASALWRCIHKSPTSLTAVLERRRRVGKAS
jgi:glycosyltransferase involved in cell wall biosynthesis